MKKIILFFCLAVGLLWTTSSAKALESIDRYEVLVKINKDATVSVLEKISYNFGNSQRHGIFRDIPNSSSSNFIFNNTMPIYNVSVKNEKGQDYIFTVNQEGVYKRIKIGDPNKTISGLNNYYISYDVDRVFNYLDDIDVLSWNAIGTDWQVPISKINVEVIFEEGIPKDKIKVDCYVGKTSSTEKCPNQQILSKQNIVDKIVFKHNNLYAHQGLTFSIAFPKAYVYQPTMIENIKNILLNNWILFLPFIFLIYFFTMWYRYGRDPEGRGNIIVQYDTPDNLQPSQLGVVLTERASNNYITAEIVNMAIGGYIRISKLEKKNFFSKKEDYLLEKLKEKDDNLLDYQKNLFDDLFSKSSSLEDYPNFKPHPNSIAQVLISEHKNDFYKKVKKVNKLIYNSVVDGGYFPSNPNKVRLKYSIFPFILVIISTIVTGVFKDFMGVVYGFSLVVSIIISIIFINIMPRKTKKGVLTKEYILGLKEYIDVAEKERIKFHNAPEKNPQLFEKLLPCAMVFGLEKKWAKQFEGMYIDTDWYSSQSGSYFNAVVLASSMSDFSSSTNSSLSSSPGGSGGGVGGGGGGGGGGSW